MAKYDPAVDTSEAFLHWVMLSLRIGDISRSLDKLIKRNRNGDDCLVLQKIRTDLDDAIEATDDIGDWIEEIEIYARSHG